MTQSLTMPAELEQMHLFITNMPGGDYIGDQWWQDESTEILFLAVEQEEDAPRDGDRCERRLLRAFRAAQFPETDPDEDTPGFIVPPLVAELMQWYSDECEWTAYT